MSGSIARRAWQLSVSAAIATLVAACAADVTSPAPTAGTVSAPRSPALHDGIQGDTTLCRSGWQTIDGRYVCNPS